MKQTPKPKPTEVEKVSCDVCLKEVPASEAHSPEVDDYVLNFCGIACFEQWKHEQADKPAQPPSDEGGKPPA